jgi:hypothetical protein
LKKYKKVYIDYFGYDVTDYIGCEICTAPSVDIHHLIPKGMGGSKTKDYIGNLIAVCRECHNKCHNSKEFNDNAKEIHLKNL